jgi:hypothetical protein
MTTNVLDIRFTDDTVADVYFAHFSDVMHGEKPRLKVQALQKINGSWKPVEDWSSKTDIAYCRDKRDERIQELVLIYSNSDAGDEPFQHDGPHVAQLYGNDLKPVLRMSNVACMPWHGTTKFTVTDQYGGTIVSTAEVTFKKFDDPELSDEEQDALTLKLFVIDHGTATYKETNVGIPGCTSSTDFVSGSMSELDGQLEVHTDSGLALGIGITTIQGATHTLSCPDPMSGPGPVAAQWFGIPVTSPTHVSEWDLTAEREE